MRRFYYQIDDMWLNCISSSKKAVMDDFRPDVVLTENEAMKRAAKGDRELEDYICAVSMCDLMCN